MGFSVGSSLLPMASVPPGRSTISGHCKHSRKGSYGLSARVGIGATAAARLICPGRVAGGSAGLSGGATAAEAVVSRGRGGGVGGVASVGAYDAGATAGSMPVAPRSGSCGAVITRAGGLSPCIKLVASSRYQPAAPPTARPTPAAVAYAIQPVRDGRATDGGLNTML